MNVSLVVNEFIQCCTGRETRTYTCAHTHTDLSTQTYAVMCTDMKFSKFKKICCLFLTSTMTNTNLNVCNKSSEVCTNVHGTCTDISWICTDNCQIWRSVWVMCITHKDICTIRSLPRFVHLWHRCIKSVRKLPTVQNKSVSQDNVLWSTPNWGWYHKSHDIVSQLTP